MKRERVIEREGTAALVGWIIFAVFAALIVAFTVVATCVHNAGESQQTQGVTIDNPLVE